MKTKWSKLQEMEKKLYLEIITGVKELDEFDRFVEEWMEAGGDQITLEVTEAAVSYTHLQVYEYATGDNSQLCLLYGVITLFVTIGFILLWRGAIRSSYIAQKAQEAGKKPITFGEVLKSLKDNRMYQLFLFFPFMGVLLFTVMPLVFMILMAFTNYDHDHLPPGQLFDWVGFQNFTKVLNAGGALGETFWKVLGWTIILSLIHILIETFAGYSHEKIDLERYRKRDRAKF